MLAGCRTRGNASFSFSRDDARPVSRPARKGEFAVSAASSGKNARAALYIASARVAPSIATWTCSPQGSPSRTAQGQPAAISR